MGRSRAWGVLPASGFGHIALSCLLTGSVACGDYTSNPDGGGTGDSSSSTGGAGSSSSTGGAGGSSSTGGAGGSSASGSSSSAYCSGSGSAGSSDSADSSDSASGSSAAGSITGGGQLDDTCDCESRDCRPAPEVANDLCCSGNLVTYIEREGCDYVELSYDYNRGWRGYYYDKEGVLVAFRLDNAFGGNLHCGEETSCTGDIIQHCVVCRASWPTVAMPDCPTTLWERSGGER